MALELVNKLPYDHPYRWDGTLFGGPKLWRPDELGASLALWLDAEDASTITLNGSTVSQWDDKSGNGRNASQGTAANQPAYTSNGLNGKPVVTFDGNNDILNTTSFLLGQTAVSVARRSAAMQPVIEGLSINRRAFWGTSGGSGFNTHANYAVNGSSAFTENGAASAVGAAFLVSQTGLLAQAATWRLGAGTPGFAPLNGYIAEIVTTNTLLSTDDRQKLEGYLAWKWGLEANLPADHPYKNTPPTV